MKKLAPYNHRPTQADVARLAGVSQSTVSQVLNTRLSPSLPLETRRRVEAAIHELGYVPNRAAQSLRTMKTRTIAFVIPDITNPFYPLLERAVQNVVDARGYDLLTYNTQGMASKEYKCLRLLLQGHVDGLISVFFHLNARDLRGLVSAGVPIVRIETRRQETGEWPLDNLYVDNVAAAHAATSHLLHQGHKQVVMIAGPKGPQNTRVEGYRKAMIAADLPAKIVHADDYTIKAGQAALDRLLLDKRLPTAIFAANDLIAIGAMKVAQRHGLEIPTDLALMGFDNIPVAELVTPSLSSVSQFQAQLGKRAAEMLFDRLEGRISGPAHCEEQAFELIIRQSTQNRCTTSIGRKLPQDKIT